MGRLNLKRVLRLLEPNLPEGGRVLDAWQENSLKTLLGELFKTGDLKKKKDAEEIRILAHANVETSVEKVNRTEEVWMKHLDDYKDRSREFVESLIGVVIGSTARFEAMSQSDIDINLIIGEPPKIASFRRYIKEFREDLKEESSKRKGKYLSLDTSHCKPFPLRALTDMVNIANSIIGYHALLDPSRFNHAFEDCCKTIDKWELIDHLEERTSRELRERKHAAIKIWFTVMMYTIRMFSLCYIEIENLCKPLPKPYWKICDELFNVSNVNRGIWHDCAIAIIETMRYRDLQDREEIKGREYSVADGHESNMYFLVEKSFNEVREEIRLKRPRS